jgi:dTDP-4-amino-4,6-dideoxy-D-glucose acyltransferase
VTATTSFYRPEELPELGLRSYGRDVLISRKASLYNPSRIVVGDHVRVDDFSLISAGTEAEVLVGDHVHIAAYVALFGAGGIVLEDYVGLASRVTIYSASDDYSGDYLTCPCVPDEFRRVIAEQVVLEEHVVIGASVVILPGVRIGVGSAVGVMSLVKEELAPWGIYLGVPARRIRPRSQGLLRLREELVKAEKG